MKRVLFYLAAALSSFSLGIFAWFINPLKSPIPRLATITPTEMSRCLEGAFTVRDQAELPARLVIEETLCNGPRWKARLALVNTGRKVITGYEIANVEAYEHKDNVISSRAEDGLRLDSGEEKKLNLNGGFRCGFTYGRRTGPIQRNIFWIKRIEYADGTSWQEKD
jgi:hypothetical protein